jgi:hypothetical protein
MAARFGGFTNAVTFSLSGLPSGATGSFNPNPTSSNTSTLRITTASLTPPGTYHLIIIGTDGTLTRTTSVALAVTGWWSLFCSALQRYD